MRLLALLLITATLAGCAADLDDAPAPAPVTDPVVPEGVRVFSGAIEHGQATIDGTGLVPPTVFGVTNMTYVSAYGPEPNIGITSSGAIFTSMFSSVFRSLDNGTTWEEVHRHATPVLSDFAGDNNDPMLWVDTDTDIIYNAPMFPILLCSTVYSSADDGDTWAPVPSRACGTGAYDHQKFASGLPGPDAPPMAGLLHDTVLYICYNGIAITNCMASYDGGLTWPVDRPTTVNTVGLIAGSGPEGLPPDAAPCLSGQNGHPTAAPDGTVAMMRTWSCIQPVLTYSTDNGLTWSNVWGPEFPGGPSPFLTTANAHSIDPEVAFTSDGTMYVLFQSWDHHAYLARTSDLGQSWDGPWDVTPPGTNSTVFAALAAGDEGRVAMAFVAANATGPSGSVPEDTRWHMWMVTSDDADAAEPTFVGYQATPDEDPVQIGQIHQGGGTDGDRNLLDFIDGAVSPSGHFYVSFTDGCSTFNDCAGLPEDDQTAAYRGGAGAVAWLEGWSLYA